MVRHRRASEKDTLLDSGTPGEAESIVDISQIDLPEEKAEGLEKHRWRRKLAMVARIVALALLAGAAIVFVILFFATDQVKDATMNAMHWLSETYQERPL
jgi:predicted anti-sigma-YlaC factor YlaD